MKTGIELITDERQKQINKHGKDAKHDSLHNNFRQLNDAAIMLLDGYHSQDEENSEPFQWDPESWYELSTKDRKDRLIIAGALIAAEIDRIQLTE